MVCVIKFAYITMYLTDFFPSTSQREVSAESKKKKKKLESDGCCVAYMWQSRPTRLWNFMLQVCQGCFTLTWPLWHLLMVSIHCNLYELSGVSV